MVDEDKKRGQLPFINGMITYGFCKVNYPEGAIIKAPRNPDYETWIRAYVAAGGLGRDGLPVVKSRRTAAPAGTSAAGIDILGQGTASTQPSAGDILSNLAAGGAQGGNEALLAQIAALLGKSGQAKTATTTAPTVDLTSLGGGTTAQSGGISLI
jgi:hypothetical protein